MKVLVDTLAGGLYVGTHVRDAWLGFLLLATLIAADNVLWRVASWIASYTFVAVTGDLRRDLFRHLTSPYRTCPFGTFCRHAWRR